MRLMVTYYDGNRNRVADVHVEEPDYGAIIKQLPDDAEIVNSIVEVMPGVDYDKMLHDTKIEENYDVAWMVLR